MVRIMAIAALTALLGCETVEGIGRDVENAGRTMQRVVN